MSDTPVRRGRREYSTADMEVGQRDDLIIPVSGPLVREREEIEQLDAPIIDGTLAELAFMEETLTIRIEPTSEKYAKQVVDVYVNGAPEWIPVGKPYTVRRKFVEVLARAKQETINTVSGSTDDANPENRVTRFNASKYPFSVLNDPSPKGAAWLTRLIAEA